MSAAFPAEPLPSIVKLNIPGLVATARPIHKRKLPPHRGKHTILWDSAGERAKSTTAATRTEKRGGDSNSARCPGVCRRSRRLPLRRRRTSNGGVTSCVTASPVPDGAGLLRKGRIVRFRRVVRKRIARSGATKLQPPNCNGIDTFLPFVVSSPYL